MATSSSALFFLVGCVCCVAIGGTRGRFTSRMWGQLQQRVDRMPYAERDYAERGETLTGPFQPDFTQPAKTFSFTGMVAYRSVVGPR